MERPSPPNVRIKLGGAVFEAAIGPNGIRRLTLPPLGEVLKGREHPVRVRIDIREDAGEPSPVSGRAGELASFLERYLASGVAGKTPDVDLGGLTGFTAGVLVETMRIPAGGTRTYREVAFLVGRPRAARAVGGALGRNPVPLLVPCHRVIRADGSPGGWSGVPGWKEWLLDLET